MTTTRASLIDTTENCRYCLMCRHMAPLAALGFQERYTPRGMALLVASQRRGMIAPSAEYIDVLYSAVDGGNSRAHCVTDQPLPAALAAARNELAEAGLAPPEAYRLNAALQTWGNAYVERKPPAATTDAAPATDALFAGDEATYLWPSALPAALRLLAAVGAQPAVFGHGRSNGFFANSLGFDATARALAQANLADLAATQAGRLLLLTAGDHFAFHNVYPERLGIDRPAGVALVEVVGVLAAALADGALRLRVADDDRPYAYIDPTHAVRVPGRHAAPRALLAATLAGPPRELFWRQERAHPAGSTAVRFVRPQVAEMLTRARLADARRAGAAVVYCEDPGTLAQLALYAGEYDLTVRGLYEWLVDALKS